MPHRTITETMDALAEYLDEFDQIARTAHNRFRAYDSSVLIELDSRAQAACTYCHMVAEADGRFYGIPRIRQIDIGLLKLWLFEDANAVIRLKKMDEDGCTRNYPTKQAMAFDRQLDLPNLPVPPVRLTAGYLLDETGTALIRSQLAKPAGRKTMWCAAIVPREERKPGERAWVETTRQGWL